MHQYYNSCIKISSIILEDVVEKSEELQEQEYFYEIFPRRDVR